MIKFIQSITEKAANFASTADAMLHSTQPQAVAKAAAIMAKPKTQWAIHAAALLLMLGVMPFASAAGFEGEAKNMANKIYKGIYGFVGVVALIVVLWQCVEGWSGRKSWMDVLATCLWVVVAAASGALVTWLWSKGQSMSF